MHEPARRRCLALIKPVAIDPEAPPRLVLGPGDRADVELSVGRDDFVIRTEPYSLNGGDQWASELPALQRRLYDAVHLALASQLSPEQVLAIGEREGWRTRRCRRGGSFDVIEFWLEDHFMLEVLTPEMQAEYLAGFRED